MYEHMTNDKVSLIKKNGEEFEEIRAYVKSQEILIEDSSLPIEEGDILLRKLPNGLFEKYVVVDRGFIGEVAGGAIPAHYRTKVRKEGIIDNSERVANITNNFHGANSRVNIQSQDYSTNVSNETNETVFNELRQAIQNNIQNDSDKELLLEKLNELQQSKGKESFLKKYQDFMQLAKTHIDIIAPYIPALTQLLS